MIEVEKQEPKHDLQVLKWDGEELASVSGYPGDFYTLRVGISSWELPPRSARQLFRGIVELVEQVAPKPLEMLHTVADMSNAPIYSIWLSAGGALKYQKRRDGWWYWEAENDEFRPSPLQSGPRAILAGSLPLTLVAQK